MADDGNIPVASDTQPAPLQGERANLAVLGPGAVLGGRYAVRETLGRGGMGVVLRAHDRVLREDVALKVLRPEYAAERRWADRLAREVRLARQIRHPNVCRVFDVEEADGHTFIVMELAPGGTLRAELDAGVIRARPLASRIADARAIAARLAAIHDAGIVHRDVTPQNVLRMADGRLVVSDFGLAIGVGETTTSIQGGTVAYMSPEVARGARATFESDVWSLGVVLHEVVFGEKPRWRSPTSFELMAPAIGRALTREENVVLEACRACTTADHVRRPRRAGAVAAQLAGGGRRLTRRWGRALVYASLGLSLAASAVITVRYARHSDSNDRAPPPEADLIVPTGEPADWTDASKILWTTDGKVTCLVVLPDRHTVRLVWGSPAHAEDVDLRTGLHSPSPLVPAAYREGCPQSSPDGRRLLYQGYVDDGRSFAFVSARPDGGDAKPVVAIDDPSILSEPKWLSDNESFVYDPDPRHVGVYSLRTNRATILPVVTSEPITTLFHYVTDMHVFVTILQSGASKTEFVELAWPSLEETRRFVLRDFSLDLQRGRGGRVFVSGALDFPNRQIVGIDPATHQAHRFGFLRDAAVRFFSLIENGAAFVGINLSRDLWTKKPGEAAVQVTRLGDVSEGARCGTGFIVSRTIGRTFHVARIAADGYLMPQLKDEQDEGQSPTCSSDGREWFFANWAPKTYGIYGCRVEGCKRLIGDRAQGLDLSPDEKRIVYITVGRKGQEVRWVSSEGR